MRERMRTESVDWKRVLKAFKKLNPKYKFRSGTFYTDISLELPNQHTISIREDIPERDHYSRSTPFYTYVKPPYLAGKTARIVLRKKSIKKTIRELDEADILKLHDWVVEIVLEVKARKNMENKEKREEATLRKRMKEDFKGVKGVRQWMDDSVQLKVKGDNVLTAKISNLGKYQVEIVPWKEFTAKQVERLRWFLETLK